MAQHDVIVIGGGQAGLAMGHCLADRGQDFVILDAAARVGDAWRSRWRSLTLFTPARYDSLPGLPFPAEPDHFPGRAEVADYLERYARTFQLPVHNGSVVHAVRALPGGGGFEVETAQAHHHARQVVIATGPFQKPKVPVMAAGLSGAVVQLHSSAYQGPAQLPPGDVLVVGAGNSGVQIAAELAVARSTWLAIGTKLPRLPERLLGRSIFWWLERLGGMDITARSRVGRRMSTRDALIGQSPRQLARASGVGLLGRVASAAGNRIGTADGGSVEIAGLVWATGFEFDFSFIRAPVLDERGRPVHERGVTAVPGLYFLGLPWQHTRGSALLGWVGRDAAWLAERIAARPRAPAGAVTAPPVRAQAAAGASSSNGGRIE